MAFAKNHDNKTRHTCLFKNLKLCIRVVDVHFTLTAQWHDKTAHGLLCKLSLDVGISDNEVVPGYSFDSLLCELLEDLAFAELFHLRCLDGYQLQLFDSLL